MTKLSEYSAHYRDMSPDGVRRASDSMERRIEAFRHRLDVELIVPRVKGPDVLDFPIGTGRFYPELIGKFNVYGYDISGPYIKRAQEQHPGLADHFTICSFEEISRHQLFDTVITLRTLNNIHDTATAVKNVCSIMKPGARWIFNYPSQGQEFNNLHSILARNDLSVTEHLTYDFVTNIRHVSGSVYATYARFIGLVERGLVPFGIFRVVDRLLRSRGTNLFICDKTPSQ